MFLLVVCVVFIDFDQIVSNRSSNVDHPEKMRTITFSHGLLWLTILEVNAELSLESVYQKVNDLEVEMIALKVH